MSLLLTLIFNIVISITIIYLVHVLWENLKNTYSVKKTKDLVNIHNNMYERVIERVNEINNNENNSTLNDNDIEKLNLDLEQHLKQQLEIIDNT
jgi:FtsZ-interacting cell division protein ZipA